MGKKSRAKKSLRKKIRGVKPIDGVTLGQIICFTCKKTLGHYVITNYLDPKVTKYNYCRKHLPIDIISEPEETI